MKTYLIIFILILAALLFVKIFILNQVTSPLVVQTGDEFNFYIISDPHYMSRKLYDDGEAFKSFLQSGDKIFQYSVELLDAFYEDVMINKPNFVVIAGDLTCSGTKESHMDFANKLKKLEDEGISVYVVPGNHDIQSEKAMYYFGDKASKAKSITKEEYLKTYSKFGYDDAVSFDENSLSYLTKPTEDIWLLMLDSTIENEPQGGYLKKETLEWIRECSNLAKTDNSKMIVVMHHSLMDHSKIINENYTINNSDEALDVLHNSGVEIVLTGHIHLQDIKSNQIDGSKLFDIATSSLVVYPHQYGEMTFNPDKGYEYKTIKLNIEQYAIKHKLTDPNLINFNDFSAEFFVTKCCKNQKKCVEGLSQLNEKEKEEVFKVVSEMNRMYFAGYRNEALEELTKTDGFKYLEKLPTCQIKNYVMAILNDEMTNNNILYVPIKK